MKPWTMLNRYCVIQRFSFRQPPSWMSAELRGESGQSWSRMLPGDQGSMVAIRLRFCEWFREPA